MRYPSTHAKQIWPPRCSHKSKVYKCTGCWKIHHIPPVKIPDLITAVFELQCKVFLKVIIPFRPVQLLLPQIRAQPSNCIDFFLIRRDYKAQSTHYDLYSTTSCTHPLNVTSMRAMQVQVATSGILLFRLVLFEYAVVWKKFCLNNGLKSFCY